MYSSSIIPTTDIKALSSLFIILYRMYLKHCVIIFYRNSFYYLLFLFKIGTHIYEIPNYFSYFSLEISLNISLNICFLLRVLKTAFVLT